MSTTSKVSKPIHYEFGGPVGVIGVILGLPIVIYSLYFLCNKDICLTYDNLFDFDWLKFKQQVNFTISGLFSTEGTFIYLGWLLFNVLLEKILPGEVVEGVILDTNEDKNITNKSNQVSKKLKYTMSGHLQFWICILAMGHAYPRISTITSLPATCLLSKTCSRFESIFLPWTNWLRNAYELQGFYPLSLDLLYDHYVPMISISIVFTTLFSLYL